MAEPGQKRDLKDTLIIIATSMTILINLSFIVGGLKGLVWLNETIDGIIKTEAATAITQEKIVAHLENLDKWKHSHEIYTAQHDKNYIPPGP